MSKKGAFSFRAATSKEARYMTSPEHNKRKKEYMERMRSSELASERSVVEDIRDDLSRYNIYYELNPGKSLGEYRSEAEKRYRESVGQKPQKKTVFIRPVMMSVDGKVTLEKIMEAAEKVKEMTGMTMLTAYYHADEGHFSTSKSGKKYWIPNYHVHTEFLSQHLEDFKYEYSYVNKKGERKNVVEIIKAGRTCRNLPYSKLQDELAPIFGMERGEVRNNDPAAFLDPTIKFARKRAYQAAQLIKAQAKLKETKEQQLKVETSLQESSEKNTCIQSSISAKQSTIDELNKTIAQKQQRIRNLANQETVLMAEKPNALQVRRFLQENRDAIFNDIVSLIPDTYPGDLEGLDLRENSAGDQYERLEMRDGDNVYHLQVFLKTGNVYLLDRNGIRKKQMPIPRLSDYLKAEITTEMRAFLEESFPVTEELKEKKQNKVIKKGGGPSLG